MQLNRRGGKGRENRVSAFVISTSVHFVNSVPNIR
ncbi:hypothetical protein D917_06735 [Trichinella nativa]|uniref:Uncharacterized protein n=1 Tax=Trichinella nativa TaxID=6335 RepID=A0A1Y3EW33_9BILA|nr:hypothetical protein D917_06735 [Trichinella nativa]